MFKIREFNKSDTQATYQLFYDTVHTINQRDYSQEQVEAWAPKDKNLEQWCASLLNNFSYVAIDENSGELIGFADLDSKGYLNRGYVHMNFQGCGVGKALLKIREEKAKALNLKKLYSDVSITAKPFFLKQGYQVKQEQTKYINNIAFVNYRMEKIIE